MTKPEFNEARPLFRKLALGLAIFCFLLALIFTFSTMEEGRWLGIGVSLFVGFVMLTIAQTGFWPGRKS